MTTFRTILAAAFVFASIGAAQADGWETYLREFVRCTEAEYLEKVGGAARVSRLEMPVF